MTLLRPEEYLEIRAAVKAVTDTFMVTPITYYRHVGMTDPNMEDNIEEAWKIYSFKALAEYMQGLDAAELKNFNEGSFDYGDVTLTMNIEDMMAVGLINSEFMPSNDTANDYFSCQGKLYKVKDTALDGPLEQKQVLVLLSGNLEQKKKNFTNIVS